MADQITRNPDGDDVGLALTWFLLAAVLGFLQFLCTSPAVVGSLLLVALAWFSGSVRHVAQVLALASLVLFALIASGVGLPLLLLEFRSYADTVARYGTAGIYKVWFNSFLEARHWWVNFSIGLVAASAVVHPKYDGTVLRDKIEGVVGKGTRLGDARTRLLIPSVNMTKGSVQMFKTAHHRIF